MEEFDELVPPPDEEGRLVLTHRAWIELDSVVWTFVSRLVYLSVAFNSIKSLPPELGDLKLLRELDCSCNHLTSLPREIGNCSRLKSLKINGNYITELPAELGRCLLLEEIIASENKLLDVPASLGFLQGLRVLRLNNNDLRILPPELGPLQIEEINCTGNRNLSMIPETIRGDTQLIKFILNLHYCHMKEMQAIEELNTLLESKAQHVEERRLRLKQEIAVVEEEISELLRERPAAYLAFKSAAKRLGGNLCSCTIS
jgi:Leucine-rich repeat (LRR) protein